MENLVNICKRAYEVKYIVEKLSTENKDIALRNVAAALVDNADVIIKANEIDLQHAEAKGMNPGLIDRLRLTEDRIKGMAEGILQVIDLPDPVGEELEDFNPSNGLKIKKVRVPMGVIGIIYESRPNVTADAFALTFKAGNAVILKGGSDAINSNKAITDIIRVALTQSDIPADAILLIESTDREVTTQFMKMKEYVDLLIPRGGAGLIRSVVENSTIPVIETGTGNCHIFVDDSADLSKAIDIILNAKTQRVGVCNACESLIIHENIKKEFLPELSKALRAKDVIIHGDDATREEIECLEATEEDFATEYLALELSIKVVSSVEEAIEHINRYSTHHSEAILTANEVNKEKFLRGVDAACVYVNSSTRFTDGFEFGFGAEIGISTQKLHARGPMGLKELTSYKYLITGDYSVRK